MAPENDNGTTEETSGQAASTTDSSTSTTSETEANGAQQQSQEEQPQQLPEDHPLVKTLAAQKEELKQLRPTAQQAKDLERQVTELQTAKTEAEQVKAKAEATQAKYDRLEAFLMKAGGPLARALDSRSFTQALFESDTDVAELVTKWHKDNPSATSHALGGTSAAGGGSKRDPNELLRIAAGHGSSD